MKIRFDHSFSVDHGFAFRKKLGRAGFKLSDHMVEHPGKSFCRFISMPITKKSGRQYLEFVHIGKGGEDYGLPGLSLGALESLEPFAKKLNSKKITAQFAHKNYEWKKNSTDRLPGWNFITFPKHKSKIFTWLTEYEYSKKRKNRLKKHSNHPNKVFKIVAIDVAFDAQDIHLLSKLCGKPKGHQFVLDCGVPLTYSKAKVSKMKAIVLASKDLKRLVQKFEWDDLTTYNGQPAVRISNPDKRMWDVLIVEG
jgi:hypothetical protein